MAAPKLRAFKSRLVFRALLLVSALARSMPLRRAQRAGRMLGSLGWLIARSERHKALANLAIAFPEWSESARYETARECFKHLGTNLFEIAHLWTITPEEYRQQTDFEAAELLQQLVRDGRTIVVFTAHCGNWEWLGSAFAGAGLPMTAVQRERDEEQMNRFSTELHARGGIKTIDRGSPKAGRELAAALRKPGLIGFLVDQSLRTPSVTVPFFDRPALTPVGPARLAIRAEALAVAVLIERLPDGRHSIRCSEPIECRRTDDPIALTALMTREIENQIRRNPAQWVWMHNRWKYRAKWDVKADSEPQNESAP